MSESMLRELISWLGLMTEKEEGKKMLKKQSTILDSLGKLVDPNG